MLVKNSGNWLKAGTISRSPEEEIDEFISQAGRKSLKSVITLRVQKEESISSV